MHARDEWRRVRVVASDYGELGRLVSTDGSGLSKQLSIPWFGCSRPATGLDDAGFTCSTVGAVAGHVWSVS